MTVYALLSDIHGNLEALRAVARDARALAAGDELAFLCLGDVVDYGPQPNECVSWVRRHATATVVGNHDRAALSALPPTDVDPGHWPILLWTRATLTAGSRAAIAGWPERAQIGPLTLFHSSLSDHDAYIDTPGMAARSLVLLPEGGLGLFGHTHVQGQYVERPRSPALGLACEPGADLSGPDLFAAEAGRWIDLPEAPWRGLVNPGSVGQPRTHPLAASLGQERDNRACYALLREARPGRWQLRFQRVAYPHQRTIERLRALRWDAAMAPELPPHPLAARLAAVYAQMPELLPATAARLCAQLAP